MYCALWWSNGTTETSRRKVIIKKNEHIMFGCCFWVDYTPNNYLPQRDAVAQTRNTYCFPTSTVVTRAPLNVTLHLQCLSCWRLMSFDIIKCAVISKLRELLAHRQNVKSENCLIFNHVKHMSIFRYKMEEMTGVYQKHDVSNSVCRCGLDTAGSDYVRLALQC